MRRANPTFGRWVWSLGLAQALVTAPALADPLWTRPAGTLAIAELAQPPATLALDGVTVYEPGQLMRYALALAARTPGPLRAADVAAALTQIYREDGYPLAEAAWDHDPATGVLRWTVLEGYVSQVKVEGVDAAWAARLQGRLTAPLRHWPTTQADLERAIALAGDLAGVTLTTRLRPDPDTAGTVLEARASVAPAQHSLSVDLVPLRPGYAKRMTLNGQYVGVLAAGDQLRLQAAATRDGSVGHSLSGWGSYRVPVSDEGRYIEVVVGNGRSEREPGIAPDRSLMRGHQLSLAFGSALRRDLHGHAYAIAVFEHADAATRIGASEPRSRASSLRLHLVQGRTDADGRLDQLALTFSTGVRPSPPAGQAPDGDAHYAHLRAAYGVSGPWSSAAAAYTYRAEAAAQWTSQALPRVERVQLGHYPFLRGYAPGEVEGDHGAAFTLEVVRRARAPDGVSPWGLFGFLAAGHVGAEPQVGRLTPAWTLASTGLGLRYRAAARWSGEAWVAVPLREGPLSGRGKPAMSGVLNVHW